MDKQTIMKVGAIIDMALSDGFFKGYCEALTVLHSHGYPMAEERLIKALEIEDYLGLIEFAKSADIMEETGLNAYSEGE